MLVISRLGVGASIIIIYISVYCIKQVQFNESISIWNVFICSYGKCV